jgi:UDP-N-acetylglucosamine 1-carboxyvinyltransferase
MEVGSFIGLAAATGGDLHIEGTRPEDLRPAKIAFGKLGISWACEGTVIHVPKSQPMEVNCDLGGMIPKIDDAPWPGFPPDLTSIITVVATQVKGTVIHVPKKQPMEVNCDLGGMIPKIDDAPWPGFPPDLTSMITVVATQVKGTVLIHEKMFESRMFFVDKLIAMGARIVLCDPHRAVVSGPAKLHGSELVSPDIRAGMAMLIAALCAEGRSVIRNVYQIERGYEHLVDRLSSLGARIVRKDD